MFKILVFLKRKPGMSVSDFRDYYENVHSRLGVKYRGKCKRYMRRYVEPFPDPMTGNPPELDFDVITELWYESRADFEATFALVGTKEISEEIFADEENLFDRTKHVFATVVECESTFPD